MPTPSHLDASRRSTERVICLGGDTLPRPARTGGPAGVLAMAFAILVLVGLPSRAVAQDDAPAEDDESRVLLVFSGDDDEVESLEAAAPRFQARVLELTEIRFAGDKEQDALYAACGEELGVSPEKVRECRLAAANRAYVSEVLELSAVADGRRAWDLTLQVWDPVANELVHSGVVAIEGKSLTRAAKKGVRQLARGYACHRGVGGACDKLAAGSAKLEISDVTPSPVTVLINGVELGPAPNQFVDLPGGEVKVTLRQAGYEDLTRTVTLVDDEMQTLSGLELVAQPARLRVTSNADGAGVWVEGKSRGTTKADDAVELELPAGEISVAVGGNGWTMHRETLTLSPGARVTVHADVEDGGPYVETCAGSEGSAADAPCTKACESGDAESCARLGVFVYSGKVGAPDFRRARALFEAGCAGDVHQACNNLGFMLEKGQGGGSDPERAESLYSSACDAGALEACFNLGYMLQRGDDVPRDVSRALVVYEKACNGGEGRACYQLGDLVFRGDGVETDKTAAAKLFERACDNDTLGGCTNLAFMLENGDGVDPDVDRAVELYDKACGGGEAGACYNLGYLVAAGEKVAKDTQRARKLFKRACDAGMQNACKAVRRIR